MNSNTFENRICFESFSLQKFLFLIVFSYVVIICHRLITRKLLLYLKFLSGLPFSFKSFLNPKLSDELRVRDFCV